MRRNCLLLLIFSGIVLLLIAYHVTWHSPNEVVHRAPTPSLIPTPSFKFVPATSITGNVAHTGRIPKIIHQTWNSTETLPETFRGWIESWLKQNDDWQYWLWTDTDMRRFMSSLYPRYLSLYDSYPAQGYRSDAFRYFVLYEHGGVYADMDMECTRPLTSALSPDDSCVMSQEPHEHVYLLSEDLTPPLVSNALMVATPRHKFLAAIINNLQHSSKTFFGWNDILHATGPPMLTGVYKAYQASAVQDNVKDFDVKVRLAEPSVFHPSVDSSMVDHMQKKCHSGHRVHEDVVKELCGRLVVHNFGRSVDPQAVTVHHWTHTWGGRAADPWGLLDMRSRFNIKDIRSENHLHVTPSPTNKT